AYRASTSNNIVIDPIITNTLSLDELPLPKRTIEVREATSHVNLEASRGCHFNCSFCHLSKTSVSFRSPQNVLKEITFLNRKLRKTFFIFNDSCFWASPADNERILEIADG